MKFSVKYDSLVNSLGFANAILSDKSVDDKMKNIIFMVEKDRVRVSGYNAFTFSRTDVDFIDVELEESEGMDSGIELFQVKQDSLNKVLSSFSSLSKTKVNKVQFSYEGVRVKVEVFEEAIKEEDSRLSQVSDFMIENVPLLSNIKKDILQVFPELTDMVPSAELGLYIDSLLPVMNNDSAGTNASKINFAEDYVFVFTSLMSGFVKNKLPDSFKDFTLSYSSISFLKKLTDSSESIMVAKIDKYLCVQGGNTEAYIRYQNVRMTYKPFIERMSKEKGISIDRLYLKDVLKRMGNMAPDGKMTINSDSLEVTNGNFSQAIPLNKVKPGTEGISFNVSIKRLSDAIIGRDDVFSGDLFIYFVPLSRSYSVYISDRTGSWLSNTQVVGI